jgi:hypothetical protein
LNRYLPLVEEGTRAYLEITESDFFTTMLPNNVVASAFANREMNLVLANYNRHKVEVITRDPYIETTDAAQPKNTIWSLKPRSLTLLRRSVS